MISLESFSERRIEVTGWAATGAGTFASWCAERPTLARKEKLETLPRPYNPFINYLLEKVDVPLEISVLVSAVLAGILSDLN